MMKPFVLRETGAPVLGPQWDALDGSVLDEGLADEVEQEAEEERLRYFREVRPGVHDRLHGETP
jgi:hypothetical protein